VRADHAAAQDHDFCRIDAGHAAQQHPEPAVRLLEVVRARLHGHPPATSDIGASSGKPPVGDVTVS
jgi:hypothetical protein